MRDLVADDDADGSVVHGIDRVDREGRRRRIPAGETIVQERVS
jgi:hypothetical protein